MEENSAAASTRRRGGGLQLRAAQGESARRGPVALLRTASPRVAVGSIARFADKSVPGASRVLRTPGFTELLGHGGNALMDFRAEFFRRERLDAAWDSSAAQSPPSVVHASRWASCVVGKDPFPKPPGFPWSQVRDLDLTGATTTGQSPQPRYPHFNQNHRPQCLECIPPPEASLEHFKNSNFIVNYLRRKLWSLFF